MLLLIMMITDTVATGVVAIIAFEMTAVLWQKWGKTNMYDIRETDAVLVVIRYVFSITSATGTSLPGPR